MISTNPGSAPAVMPHGFMPYYWATARHRCASPSATTGSPADQPHALGETVLFFMDGATVVANGKTIVRTEKLLDQ